MTVASDGWRPGRVGDIPAKLLQSYPVAAHALPPRDVRWAESRHAVEEHDVEPAPEALRPHLDRFRTESIVEVVGHVCVQDRRNARRRKVYRTAPGVTEWVDLHVDEPTTLPCGHAGLRNLGDDRYTCQDDRCNAEFGRAAARAYLERRSA